MGRGSQYGEVVQPVDRRDHDPQLPACTFIIMRVMRPFPSANGWTSLTRRIMNTARANGLVNDPPVSKPLRSVPSTRPGATTTATAVSGRELRPWAAAPGGPARRGGGRSSQPWDGKGSGERRGSRQLGGAGTVGSLLVPPGDISGRPPSRRIARQASGRVVPRNAERQRRPGVRPLRYGRGVTDQPAPTTPKRGHR